MTEAPIEVVKSSPIQIPHGFPDEVMKAVKKGLEPQPQRGLSFQNRAQRNTAYLKKGLTKPGKISYDTLRRASMSVHIVRICVHTLKQKVTKTKWIIQNKDINKRKGGQKDERIKEVEDLFKHPNKNNETFRTLMDKMIEDLLVLDSVSVEKTRFPNGKLAELFFVDSATIRPVYNDRGDQDILLPLKTVDAKEGEKMLPVSYVQILDNSQYGGPESGEIVAAWPKRDFLHFHMNPQGAMESFGYGLSPIEGILSVVANLLNADNYNSTYFEEGAFPPIVLQLIGQVNQRDLEAYREYLVAELTGNFHRPAIMATEKAESLQIHNLKDITNQDMQFMEYQNWLANLVCAMYGLSPQDIGLTDTTGSKSVAEKQGDISDSKGYSSILDLFEEVFNQEIVWKDFGYEDLEFRWVATDQQSPQEASVMFDRDLRNGTTTINEVREKRGEAPYGDWANEPMILSGDSYKPIDPEKALEQQQSQQEHELKLKGAGQVGNEKPYNEQENGEKEGEKLEKMRKAIITYGGVRTWADDRGYSQPFIYMNVKSGWGTVIKPPVAVNLQSQELEISLTAELSANGLNVKPVRKMTYIEVIEMLRATPEVYQQFLDYTNMAEGYDSEKWRAKFGGSRKFNYYLVSDYIDGYNLANPLLLADMKRDPNSYMNAISDLAALWRVERDMVLGDRRADQYIIGHDKRAYGFDYQFRGDTPRWEKTKDCVRDALSDIPQLMDMFDKEVNKEKEPGLFKSIMKTLRG